MGSFWNVNHKKWSEYLYKTRLWICTHKDFAGFLREREKKAETFVHKQQQLLWRLKYRFFWKFHKFRTLNWFILESFVLFYKVFGRSGVFQLITFKLLQSHTFSLSLSLPFNFFILIWFGLIEAIDMASRCVIRCIIHLG